MSIIVNKKYLESLLMNHSSLNQNKKALQKELNTQKQKHMSTINKFKSAALRIKSLEKELHECLQKVKRNVSPKRNTPRPVRRSARVRKPPRRFIEEMR